MSYIAENPMMVAQVVIALIIGLTTLKIAWSADWGWIWGFVLAGILVTLTFFFFPWGALGAAAIVGKLYMAYG